MWYFNHSLGQLAENHLFDRYPPNLTLLESVKRFNDTEVTQRSGRNIDLPLNWNMNDDHARKSVLASFDNCLWWWDFFKPIVRSMIRRKNALPGTITAQAKLNKPITDCSSRRVAFSRCLNLSRARRILLNFSWGNIFSISTESNSIPTKDMILHGRQVLAWLIGKPTKAHQQLKFVNLFHTVVNCPQQKRNHLECVHNYINQVCFLQFTEYQNWSCQTMRKNSPDP